MDPFFQRVLQAHTANFALILFHIQFLCMENIGENVYCVWKFKDYFLKYRPMDFTSVLSRDAYRKERSRKHKPRKMENSSCFEMADLTQEHLPLFSFWFSELQLQISKAR